MYVRRWSIKIDRQWRHSIKTSFIRKIIFYFHIHFIRNESSHFVVSRKLFDIIQIVVYEHETGLWGTIDEGKESQEFKPHCSRKVTASMASPDLLTTFSKDSARRNDGRMAAGVHRKLCSTLNRAKKKMDQERIVDEW